MSATGLVVCWELICIFYIRDTLSRIALSPQPIIYVYGIIYAMGSVLWFREQHRFFIPKMQNSGRELVTK